MATYALFFVVGFLTDFTTLAEFYLMRELGLDIASCYAAATVINIPWSLRPIWGYGSDVIGRRHIQLSVVFFIAFVVWMSIRGVRDPNAVISLLFLCEIATAVGMTIADAYAVRLTATDVAAMPKHHRFRIVGRVVGAFSSGKALSEWQVSHESIATLFLIQSLCYLALTPLAFLFLDEHEGGSYVAVAPAEEVDTEDVTSEPTPLAQQKQAGPWQYVKDVFSVAWADVPVRTLLIFFTLYAALPDSGTSFSYFVVGPLGISPLTMATMEAVRGVFDLLGTFVRPDVSPIRAMGALVSVNNLLAIPIVAIVCRSAGDWFDDRAILVVNTAVMAWIMSAFSTVFTVQLAKISPKGKEGGTFNGLISIPNIGQALGVSTTYSMTKWYGIDHDDFNNLPEFVVVTSLMACALSVVFTIVQISCVSSSLVYPPPLSLELPSRQPEAPKS